MNYMLIGQFMLYQLCSPRPLWHGDQEDAPTAQPALELRSQCIVVARNVSKLKTQCSGPLLPLGQFADIKVDDKIGQAPGAESVADILLVRGGAQYTWRTTNLQQEFVCNGHYEALLKNEPFARYKIFHKKIAGRKSRPYNDKPCGLKCFGNGTHTDDVPADLQYMTRLESLALHRIAGVFFPLGTPICAQHREFIGMYVAKHLETDTPKGSLVKERWAKCPAGNAEEVEHVEGEEEEVNAQRAQPLPPPQTPQYSEMEQQVRTMSRMLKSPISILTRPWSELLPSVQKKKQQQFFKLIKAQSSVIHGKEGLQVVKEILKANVKCEGTAEGASKNLHKILLNIATGFYNVSTSQHKKQILSLVAPIVTYGTLLDYIPDLSQYYFTEARKYADIFGPGHLSRPLKITRQKFQVRKVRLFVDYITSPAVVVDLPFGFTTAKKSDGTLVELPNVLRLLNPSRIILQYELWLKENNVLQNAKLSHTTYRKILKVCRAQTRRSAHGLDYYTNDALAAFLEMEKILGAKYSSQHTDDARIPEPLKKTLKKIQLTQNYYRVNYKIHAKEASLIADHCTTHALSDPLDIRFQGECSHNHTKCEDCERGKAIFDEVADVARSFPSNTSVNHNLFILERAKKDIEKFKAHQLRTVNQERAKQDVLRDMSRNDVFITLDWAMKWQPQEGREDSRSWFGKKGLSWHIAVVLAKSDDYYNHRVGFSVAEWREATYVHVLQQSNQRAADVAAIIRDVISQIKFQKPNLEKVYLRSDKAKCYHNSILLGTLVKIGKEHNVSIARWDFSEPQSGKSSCDRTAARIKGHVNRFLDSRGSCKDAAEFAQCIAHGEGLTGVQTIQVGIDYDVADLPKFTIPGISKFNNFAVETGGVRMWKAYGIGEGQLYPHTLWEDSGASFTTAARVIDSFVEGTRGEDLETPTGEALEFFKWRPIDTRVDEGAQSSLEHRETTTWRQFLNEVMDAEEATEANRLRRHSRPQHRRHKRIQHQRYKRQVFEQQRRSYILTKANIYDIPTPRLHECPEPGCSAKFFYHSWLDKHLSMGRHNLMPDKESLRDTSLGLFSANLERNGLQPLLLTDDNSLEFDSVKSDYSLAPPGWALQTTAVNKRFTNQQRDYLTQLFWSGEQTKRKSDPTIVSQDMRREFPVEEWLKPSQILGFWTRSASAMRREAANAATVDAAERERAAADAQEVGMREDYEQDLERWNQMEMDEFYLTAQAAGGDAASAALLHSSTNTTNYSPPLLI